MKPLVKPHFCFFVYSFMDPLLSVSVSFSFQHSGHRWLWWSLDFFSSAGGQGPGGATATLIQFPAPPVISPSKHTPSCVPWNLAYNFLYSTTIRFKSIFSSILCFMTKCNTADISISFSCILLTLPADVTLTPTLLPAFAVHNILF